MVYFDGIMVAGALTEEHLHTLDKVLSKLAVSGLQLKKAGAINEAQSPKNITEIISFLGLLNLSFCPTLPPSFPLCTVCYENSKNGFGQQNRSRIL